MPSTVCQGLQSCLEPRFSEPNILIHNLSSPKSNPFNFFSALEEKIQEKEEKVSQNENNTCIQNCDKPYDNGGKMGGWSFIQTFSNTKKGKTEQVYVHPLVKRNSNTLSSKSLEMCTESLGSETGSDISENNDVFESMLTETNNSYGTYRSKPRKMAKKVEFPPPLTSIISTDGVQVRPHREGGRLILEAVSLPPCNTYFHAERVDGRLRLSFLKGSDDENDIAQSDINEEEIAPLEDEDNAVEAIAGLKEEKCNCKDIIDDGEEEDDGSDGSSSSLEDEVKKGNVEEVGCEIMVGEYQWMRWCKGGNGKVMPNCWEAYCQAIS